MDDNFRLGIRFQKKGFHLFADYNSADIVICSPLGIRSLEEKKAEVGAEAGFGFLSSAEILVIDKPNIFKMQNYLHLDYCLELMNRMPRHNETVSDFNTLRPYYSENLSRFYRQTIVYTDFFFPELNITLDTHALNFAGAIKNKVTYGCIFEDFKSSPLYKIEFLRMEITDPSLEFDNHFNFFVNQIWTPLQRTTGIKDRTIVFVSTYPEFVRLKKHFKQGNNPGGFICEYTDKQEMQKIVHKFNTGELKFLLLTEKAHYFSICTGKKFLHAIFYSLPQNAGIFKYYVENLKSFIEGGGALNPSNTLKDELEGKKKAQVGRPTIQALYSMMNSFELERICGSTSAKDMLNKHNKMASVEF